jgi:hypothetical protein
MQSALHKQALEVREMLLLDAVYVTAATSLLPPKLACAAYSPAGLNN